MAAIPRILDANANRAREALRVLEDAARFALNDADLTAELKSLRHELRAGLDRLPPGWLEANRDTAGDVGTDLSATDEMSRSGLVDVAVSAGKRLSESLRVIEETAKTFNPDLAREVEGLRYRAYELERRLLIRLGTGRAGQWKLCLLLTRSLCTHPWQEVVQASIEGGADAIQIREKEMSGGELARHVAQVIRTARPAGISVIVNDRVDVALAVNADGVHLGQHDLSVGDVRRVAGRQLLVGLSTHTLDEAESAAKAGADYCGVGMMFPSPLKRDRVPSGPGYLRAFLERYPHQPHLAVGGITPENIHELIEAGARGVAVCSAICGANDPGSVVEQLREALEGCVSPAT